MELSDVVRASLDDVEHFADRHEIVWDIPEDLPKVYADRDKLTQVVINLLDNSIKYSPNGSRIQVSANYEADRDRVVVGVSDQGIGISPEDQEPIFGTLLRVSRPEIESTSGFGMGLYIVKEFLELMGGEIWVESQLDEGSTFYFSLPTRAE